MQSRRKSVFLSSLALVAGLTSFAVMSLGGERAGQPKPGNAPSTQVTEDKDATVHIGELVVPYSVYASPESKAEFLKLREEAQKAMVAKGPTAQRQAELERYKPALERLKQMYPVDSVPTMMAGVYTDVFTPKEGIAARNKNRVLIELHGGGFMTGARIIGALEAIPVAGLGKIKVIAVDYRQGPEHKFPAASEDVTMVYRDLLKTYEPRNIGIYGCSAGGMLAAEMVPWIAKERLPAPGAVGMFCGAGAVDTAGDSGAIGFALMGFPPFAVHSAYFDGVDTNNPLIQPVLSAAVLAKFPPSLLITSTRDQLMSSVIYTHAQLVKNGVGAELHVWDGMVHSFFVLYPEIPETKEALNVIVTFFDKHLGRDPISVQ